MPDWSNLGFTSGRRTYRGNRLVGGVPNSGHLYGTAADFTAPIEVLRARFPNNPILDEGDHRHVSGLSDVPYHGQRGTAGLVNGIDTSAPKGQPMQRNPRTLADVFQPGPNMDPYGLVGPDKSPMQASPVGNGSIDFGQIAQLATVPKIKKGGLFGSGMSLGEALAHGLVGFAAGMGNPHPMEALQRARIQQDDRNFARERLAAEIEMARQKRMEPPQEFQTTDYYNRLPEPQRQAFLTARDAISPIVADIAQPDGSVRRSVIPRGQMSGPRPGTVEDGHVFLGGDPADPKNWRPQ